VLDTILCTTNTSNVNKTCALLQTTGRKDEPNILIGQNTHTKRKKREYWDCREHLFVFTHSYSKKLNIQSFYKNKSTPTKICCIAWYQSEDIS
jgi:hypothetical protein